MVTEAKIEEQEWLNTVIWQLLEERQKKRWIGYHGLHIMQAEEQLNEMKLN